MSLPFLISSDFITVVCGNRPHTIYSNESRFAKLRDAIKNRAWDEIINIVSLPKSIALFSKGKVQVFDGAVLYNGKEVHNTLTARILEFHREGFPFESLTSFMDKLMENPSERSRDQLFAYLELYRLPITDDGDFVAQKKITVDYKDIHTGSINNSVGQIIQMDRALVNDDPSQGCHTGLHLGSEDFVQSFGGEGVTILCKVNPKDVVSIPFDASYAKMRVCRYEVIGEVKGDDKKFTSNYAGDSNVTKDICTKEDANCSCGVEYELIKEIPANKEDSTMEETDNLIKQQYSPIGQNPAYEAHKRGLSVYSFQLGNIDPQPPRPRSFFRQAKDWRI